MKKETMERIREEMDYFWSSIKDLWRRFIPNHSNFELWCLFFLGVIALVIWSLTGNPKLEAQAKRPPEILCYRLKATVDCWCIYHHRWYRVGGVTSIKIACREIPDNWDVR